MADSPEETEPEAFKLDPGLRPEEASQVLTQLRGIITTVILLRDWRRRGTGPRYIKRGRLIFYRREELERWVEMEEKGEAWKTPIQMVEEKPKEKEKSTTKDHTPSAGTVHRLDKTERDGVYRCPAGNCYGLLLVKLLPINSRFLPAIRANTEREFWDSTAEVVIWEKKTETLIRLELKPSEARCVVALMVNSKEFWK